MLAVSRWGEEKGWIYSQYNEASSGVIIFFIFTLGNQFSLQILGCMQ